MWCRGTPSQLSGCITDACNVKQLLLAEFGLQEPNVRLLLDDSSDASLVPTADCMLASLRWLVAGQKPGDLLFFYFSGPLGRHRLAYAPVWPH